MSNVTGCWSGTKHKTLGPRLVNINFSLCKQECSALQQRGAVWQWMCLKATSDSAVLQDDPQEAKLQHNAAKHCDALQQKGAVLQ